MPKINLLIFKSLAIFSLSFSTSFTAVPQNSLLTADSFESLIYDFEKYEININPIKSGQLGNRPALRMLPNVSIEAQKDNEALIESFIQRHLALSKEQMDENIKLSYELLGFELNQRKRLFPYDTMRIPFTNDSGFFNEMSYISRQTKFEVIDDYDAYASRLSKLPKYFEEHKKNMRRGINTQFTASVEIMPGIIKVIDQLSKGDPKEHPFYIPFKNYPHNFNHEEKNRLDILGETTVINSVLPAYKDLKEFIESEYLPKTRLNIGIGTNNNNREYYKALIKNFTTLEITPDEVHNIGVHEVQRIRSEMDAVIRTTNFKGTFSDFLKFLRTSPQFYASTKKQLLKEASYLAKKIDGRMPEFFQTLPRLPYGIIPVPKEIQENYTTGRYWGGSPELNKAGNYVVNTYDLKQRPLYNLPALTAHEGVPGHHHQIALSQEIKNVPSFRKDIHVSAYVEGWGLYAEKLAGEMGIYETAYDKFGQLTYEMWRACRLLVDTGIHWKGWNREKAEECFFNNTALAPYNIKTEVDRYISWPGQAVSYKIGELKILELRKFSESQLGHKFNIREFHDQVLINGSLPLNILERKIKEWVKNKL
ncbi:MAG: DUF885 domain-containing protein [Hellea sp.]|jgi:uncharacterized protein (DUF885 family)